MTRSAWVIVVTLLAVLAIASTIGDNSRPQYIWNLTPSVPLGLYSLHSPSHLRVTTPWPQFHWSRSPPRSPKAVTCRVVFRCSSASSHFPDRLFAASAHGSALTASPPSRHATRLRGRPLPAWHGCRVLAADEIFLMNWDEPDSLDGRYFGPLPRSAVIARAIPILTDEAGDGHLVWRAPTE
jgi:type IV secretory pathway protease TraF